MNPENVNPGKWGGTVEVIFDNDEISVCRGKFEGTPNIGIRYNGYENVGYPNQGGNPIWFVVPHVLQESVLLGCLKLSALEEHLYDYIPLISTTLNNQYLIKEA